MLSVCLPFFRPRAVDMGRQTKELDLPPFRDFLPEDTVLTTDQTFGEPSGLIKCFRSYPAGSSYCKVPGLLQVLMLMSWYAWVTPQVHAHVTDHLDPTYMVKDHVEKATVHHAYLGHRAISVVHSSVESTLEELVVHIHEVDPLNRVREQTACQIPGCCLPPVLIRAMNDQFPLLGTVSVDKLPNPLPCLVIGSIVDYYPHYLRILDQCCQCVCQEVVDERLLVPDWCQHCMLRVHRAPACCCGP